MGASPASRERGKIAYMQPKHRVLIAAQPAAATVLQEMLEDVLDLIPAYTRTEGLAVLQSEPGSIALIISTIAFDDSRMLEFLETVKRNSRTSAISFLCCRILPSVLPNDSMERLGQLCRYLGAADFIDFPAMDLKHGAKAAQAEFRNAVMKCVAVLPGP